MITEDKDKYVWVFRKMVEMEPRFKLDNIRFIFVDQGVTQKLLEVFGIETSCTLRGDYHHLMREVWSKSENSGKLVMQLISPFEKNTFVKIKGGI